MPATENIESESPLKKVENLLKKIWLANLGVCGRSLEGIQSRYNQLNSERQRIFDELVNKGENVESGALKAVTENRKKLQQHLKELKQRLTFKSKLSTQLDEVNAKLDELAKATSKA